MFGGRLGLLMNDHGVYKSVFLRVGWVAKQSDFISTIE